MKIYLFLIVIFSVIYTSWAAAYRSDPSTNKGTVLIISSNKRNKIKLLWFQDFPCQCYVESEKRGYTVGTHTPIGNCQQVTCFKDWSYEVYTYVLTRNMFFFCAHKNNKIFPKFIAAVSLNRQKATIMNRIFPNHIQVVILSSLIFYYFQCHKYLNRTQFLCFSLLC